MYVYKLLHWREELRHHYLVGQKCIPGGLEYLVWRQLPRVRNTHVPEAIVLCDDNGIFPNSERALFMLCHLFKIVVLDALDYH